MKKNNIWGIILIILGILIGLNKLDIININIFFDGWWCLFIIIPCFIGIFTDSDKIGNIIGLLVGICLLLGCNDVIEFDIILELIFPIILVLVGISIILKGINTKKINIDNKNSKGYNSLFSSQKINIDGEYNGSNINAIFGGVELNLVNSNIKKDIVIDLCAIFGGIDIIVPDNVNVIFNATCVFGGCSDKRKKIDKDNKINIYINGLCLFGGVDVK